MLICAAAPAAAQGACGDGAPPAARLEPAVLADEWVQSSLRPPRVRMRLEGTVSADRPVEAWFRYGTHGLGRRTPRQCVGPGENVPATAVVPLKTPVDLLIIQLVVSDGMRVVETEVLTSAHFQPKGLPPGY
ncbi:hypothetical protein OJ997_25645 [Solirubrobacter phytolaccae]|uniref:Uncharacterized protein n=1 Tax=Solirubrobacter phytolaccae TaxID=1404360 RepID=A0A9X3NC35_9ACTN|nr:hypothetical protein [Solirubrobacter phytolaccae]MDA0183718.1 hypothetical protein [Solirubrobacter phytolaccae]